VVQVRCGHEDHDPAGRPQPIQPVPVRGDLLPRLAVPVTLVLDRDLRLGPGEVHAGDEAAGIADDELGDRPRQRRAVQQEPQAGLLRGGERHRLPDLAAPRTGRHRRHRAHPLESRHPSGDEPVDEDDDLVQRSDPGQIHRRRLGRRRPDTLAHRDVGVVKGPDTGS
jgi:hypothetical protein